MKIALTITISKTDHSYDIQVNHEQKIKDTLEILKENLIPDLKAAEEIIYVRAMRTKRRINIELSYGQAGIYEGENLVI